LWIPFPLDPVSASVEGSVALPELPVGLAASPDGTIYAILSDLRMVEIDAARRSVVREVTTEQLDAENDRQSLITVLTIATNGGGPSSASLFSLPALAGLPPVPLPEGYNRITPAEEGEVYILPDWNEAGPILRLSPELTEASPVLDAGGPVYRVVADDCDDCDED
jgi:hypothetical protein